MIRFGLLSIVLLVGAIQGVVVSVGLVCKSGNRQANALLAGLIFLLALKLTPYIIGYAGFYMVYPWLDLAPFDMGLGFGPLLYLYIGRLTRPKFPVRWWLHLVPLAVQFGLYLVLFLQPMSFKNSFEDHIGDAFNRIENGLVGFSFCIYLWLTWARYREYERWLSDHFSNPELHRIKLLRLNLVCITGVLLSFVGAILWSLLIKHLTYFQMFPFYLLLTVVVYAFGFTAFRIAEVRFPVDGDQVEAKETDWAGLAAQYTALLTSLTFWRDPLLSLATAAQAIQTTEGKLSRALNLGLGVSFSTWINRYRIEQVAAILTTAPEEQSLQEIAQSCGFNSKASFNRWFKAVKGCTPTEFRERSSSRTTPSQEPRPAP